MKKLVQVDSGPLSRLRGYLNDQDNTNVFRILREWGPDNLAVALNTAANRLIYEEDIYGPELALGHQLFKEIGKVRLLLPTKKKIVEGRRYGRALANLREVCAEDENSVQPEYRGKVRPLTFRETLAARLESYFTSEKRKKFFNTYLYTCTAVAYRGNLDSSYKALIENSKFKIIPISSDLLGLEANFNETFVQINYDSLGGVELDRKDAAYNRRLTKDEVVKHPAWLAAVEGDERLLKDYSDLVFPLIKKRFGLGKSMPFMLRSNVEKDQLSSLSANLLDANLLAEGRSNFHWDADFLRLSEAKDKTKP